MGAGATTFLRALLAFSVRRDPLWWGIAANRHAHSPAEDHAIMHTAARYDARCERSSVAQARSMARSRGESPDADAAEGAAPVGQGAEARYRGDRFEAFGHTESQRGRENGRAGARLVEREVGHAKRALDS